MFTGKPIALPKPSNKVNITRIEDVVTPPKVRRLRIRATASEKYCVARKSLRLSTMSARAPAGNASRNIDKLVITCKRATTKGDGTSDVINHPEPTVCMEAPMSDANIVTHRNRYSVFFRGLSDEVLMLLLVRYHTDTYSAIKCIK